MNNKKFQNKCKDLILYETDVLQSSKQFFHRENQLLMDKDLALDVDLIWGYAGEEEDYFNRIEFRDKYHCILCIKIRKKDEPRQDFDLKAIWYFLEISAICKWGRFYTLFHKSSLKRVDRFLNDVKEMIVKVLNDGYDNILKELKWI